MVVVWICGVGVALVLLAVATILAVLWASGELNFRWTNSRIAQTQLSGNRIADAVEQFRAENGRYPSELHELVPKYIAELPIPNTGNDRWRYRHDEDKSYELSFSANADGYPCCFTEGEGSRRKWRVDD